MSDERDTLTIPGRKNKAQLRAEQAERDFQSLALREEYLRFLFTVLSTAGMFTGNYQPDGRNHAFAEGRRSLGLDILRTAEKYLGPDALSRILAAENKTLIGAPDGRPDDRDDDGTDDGPRAAGTGLVFIDYGPDKG